MTDKDSLHDSVNYENKEVDSESYLVAKNNFPKKTKVKKNYIRDQTDMSIRNPKKIKLQIDRYMYRQNKHNQKPLGNFQIRVHYSILRNLRMVFSCVLKISIE